MPPMTTFQWIFKVVAGNHLYKVGSVSREEMAKWSRHELVPDSSKHHGWRRLNDD